MLICSDGVSSLGSKWLDWMIEDFEGLLSLLVDVGVSDLITCAVIFLMVVTFATVIAIVFIARKKD